MPWKYLAVLLAATFIEVSCGASSNLPKPGSPASYWASASAAYRAGDFVKADEELQRVLTADSEFTARARAWDMVISGGLSQGYSALSDTYETGARNNRQNPLPYRKRVSELRALSGNMSLQLAEDVHKFLAENKDATVAMAFAYPAGAAAEPAGLTRVAKGLFAQEAEQQQLQTAMLQRGVVLAVCAASGSGEDSAKTLQMFQAGEVKVPRETFLFAAAKMLESGSDVFGVKKQDLPNKLKIVLQEATSALKAIPSTKDSKALADKIDKTMKKANLAGL
jgi:hypothetical protein